MEQVSAVGTIRGTVTNGSPGGDLPGDLEITLSGFDGEQEAYTQSSSVAADGGYAFSDVPVVAGRVYGVTVGYKDVLYFSDGAHLTGDLAPLDMPVTVFETTTDPAALTIERLHVLFDFSAADQVQVIELWVVSNAGDRTVVAAPSRGTLEVSLPEGATDLGFEDGSIGDRYILTADGFGDTQPVVPGSGTSQFIFSYRLPYDGKITFRQPSTQPIQAVVVLLPQNGVTAEGGGLQDQGQLQMGGQGVHSYAGGAIAAGQALEFELSGSPQSRCLVDGRRRLDEHRHRPGGVGSAGDPRWAVVVPPHRPGAPAATPSPPHPVQTRPRRSCAPSPNWMTPWTPGRSTPPSTARSARRSNANCGSRCASP